MTLTFRPATANDIPTIRELADRTWRVSYAAMISEAQIDYMLARMYSADQITGELAQGVLWWLAECDTRPVGYLSISQHSPTLAELNKLYLLPELQGRGLGQTMLAHACAVAVSLGAAELRLRVNKGNARALRAYERAGFRVIDSLVADIGGGFVMDDYVLSRAITAS